MIVFLLIINLLQGINSSVCKFEEKVMAGGDVLKEKGYFYFLKGKGFRWDYLGEEKKIFLLTRGFIWEYYPEDKFLRKYRAQENLWLLIENPDKWKELADAIVEKKGKIFVKLKGGEEAVIELKNGKIRKVSFGDTVFEFSQCKYNVPLPSSLFNPTFLFSGRKK